MTSSISESADYKMFEVNHMPSTDTSFDEINQSIQFYTNDPSSSALVIQEKTNILNILSQSRLENLESYV